MAAVGLDGTHTSRSRKGLLVAALLTGIATYLAYYAFESRQEASWMTFVPGLAVETTLAVIIYRLTLHPLARYPGPVLAAATDWYNVYHCYSGDRHLDFYRLHEQYGPAVRFGPNRVSFCTQNALQDIYGVRANTQKSQVYSAFMHFFSVPATLTTIDRRIHSFKRRVTNRALTTSAVKGLEELILRNVRIFCTLLLTPAKQDAVVEVTSEKDAGWSMPQDMTKRIQFLLSDVMGDVTFSKNWDIQNSEKNRYILDLMNLGTCGINLAGHMPTLLKLKLDQICFPSLTQGVKDFFRLSESQSSWRVAQDPASLPNQDLFAALLNARDPDTGKGYTERDLIAEAGILIIAGADTTATATTATLFYLLHSPTAYARARAEVDAAFTDKEQAQTVESIRIGPSLTSCTFLYACIDEAMRLSPSVGAMLPREVLPGGLHISNDSGDHQWYIPPGTDVGVPTYALHHSAAYWGPDPHSFRPERWFLDDDNTKPVHRDATAFAPFGAGRTSCVGKYLAYQEMGIILARMLWLYDMRVAPGTHKGEGGKYWSGMVWESKWGRQREDEFQLRDVFASTHEGPLVQFRVREGRGGQVVN